MKMTLAEPRYFKDSISIISELVNEARFKVSSTGIELVAMDPANVAMVLYKLLSSSFVEYKVDKEREIGINLGNLKQVLRRIKPNDMLSLEVGTNNKLKVTLKSNTTRVFSLPIIELDEKEQRIPDLKFPVKITTKAQTLNDAIEDADIVGESVTFSAVTGKFSVFAEGDLSRAEIDIPEDEETKVMLQGSDKVKAKYSVEYLKKMITGAKLTEDVTIQFNNDYPLKISFDAVDRVSLAFILAPRVEND